MRYWSKSNKRFLVEVGGSRHGLSSKFDLDHYMTLHVWFARVGLEQLLRLNLMDRQKGNAKKFWVFLAYQCIHGLISLA